MVLPGRIWRAAWILYNLIHRSLFAHRRRVGWKVGGEAVGEYVCWIRLSEKNKVISRKLSLFIMHDDAAAFQNSGTEKIHGYHLWERKKEKKVLTTDANVFNLVLRLEEEVQSLACGPDVAVWPVLCGPQLKTCIAWGKRRNVTLLWHII